MIYKIIRKSMVFILHAISTYRRILVAAAFAGVALFLGFALWYYMPYDQSMFYYSTQDTQVANHCGSLGANTAALFTYFFGGASFIVLILMVLGSYMIATRRSIKTEWDRIVTLIIMLFVTSALLASYSYDPIYAQCPGGYCGMTLWTTVADFFDQIAATFLLIALLLMTIIVVSRFPFITVYYHMKKVALYLYGKRFLLVPVYRIGKSAIYYMFYPFKALIHWLYRLFTGATIVNEHDESVATFEYNLEEAASVEDIVQDQFWQGYRNEMSDKECGEDEHLQGAECIEGEEFIPIHNTDCEQEQRTSIQKRNSQKAAPYELPDPELFIDQRDEGEEALLQGELESRARILEEKLERFGISGKVVAIKRGPVVTLFEYQPHIDTKLSKIIALEDDLAMALQALSIRIIAPIPGRAVVGFEVSNNIRHNVLLGSIIQSKKFRSYTHGLPLILGCDTIGTDVIIDLAKMPHLLIAGSTGSGKSVALNSMLISLLCRCSPEELRLILIDPKRLEFASYEDIAHLLFPIVTDPKQAILALRWVVKEMERRYETMKELGARNMVDYNAAAVRNGLEPLPFIAIIIDELSDLMITAGKDIEDLIIRITQMARAAGIHMLVATQRPSVDVITGVIKVNFPSRISFRVTSKVDSRTILDCSGAEKLLGRGDMLFLDAGSSQLHRVHGAYVSDAEIEQVVASIKEQREPHYCELAEENVGGVDLLEGDDQLYNDIVTFLDGIDEVSISLLQRRFRIGYNRSARIIEMLEAEGVIAPSDGGKMRKVIH